MAKTQRGRYLFTVKEYERGQPWIMLEPAGSEIKLPGDGFIGFDLPDNTSVKKAEHIALFMRENLGDLSLTTF